MLFTVTFKGTALVFFTFKDLIQHGNSFDLVYEFDLKKNSLEPVHVGDLGNNDSRFWNARPSTANNCEPVSVSVDYDGCTACDVGSNLSGTFTYKSGHWNFKEDAGNAEKWKSYEEVD